MSQLPDRPDLDQLRHQARELHRAAEAGDPAALDRLRAVSATINLSAAQLAVAREHGFPSWPRLKAEVGRVRAALGDAGPAAPSPAAPAPPEAPALEAPALEAPALEAPALEAPALEAPALEAPALSPEDEELISGQYADRPHLRPVLDAVLAALPSLGPVTVAPRRTCVSLISPSRVFAAVQPTAKSRVDLGLRLVGREPAGRLLVARDVGSGAITLRIPLSDPGEFDEEAIGWLRRAYEESMAPPPPRRPARRQAPEIGALTVVIEGRDLPGRAWQAGPDDPAFQNVHIAVYSHSQDRPSLPMTDRRWLATEPQPGDAPSVRWEVPVTVRRDDDGLDFSGPFVRGARNDRHLGLAWGDVPGNGTFRLFRGAKLRLLDVDPALIEEAMRPGRRLVARIRLTDRGDPRTARLPSPALTWTVEPAEA